jgi:protoporphyrinogen oxidase
LWGGKSRNIKTLVEEFDYPVLGAGQMYEAMSDRVVSKGATLMLDSSVIRLNRQDNTIKSIDILKLDGHKINITADQFFSSIPLSHFFKILNHAADMLRYRDHITVNLLVRRENVFPDQWIYVHSPEVHIARITNYNNFSQAMVGRGNKTALSVEYFLFKNKGLWNERDEFLVDLTTHELREMGLIRPDEVENTWVVRETEAYPIYDLGFQEPLRLLKSRIGQFVNCYSIGRGGMHQYNNQDHSLMSGILAARNYLKFEDSPYLLWDINIDAEYHENTQRAD